MSNSISIEQIEKKQEQLKEAGEELKKHFIGLDEQIDRIIHNMEVWWVMPELLRRPVIINLWGMTGVGKTDLVRRLVRALGIGDEFVEVQLTNRGSSSHPFESTINGILSDSSIEPGNRGVLLLDEVQRFRSKDSSGEDIHDYKFQDVWTLLSDGRFGLEGDMKRQMLSILFDAMYNADNKKYREAMAELDEEPDIEVDFVPLADEEDTETGVSSESEAKKKAKAEAEKKRQFRMSYYSARQLKRTCRLEEDVQEIMSWGTERKLAIIEARMKNPESYEGDDYSKMLIFISGNLDEAYSMSMDTDESDIDADLFHKHTKNINILTIKRALNKRFKPEQIARFGNTHVIYPAMSRASYEELIRRQVGLAVSDIKEKAGLSISVDNTVLDAIYRNGVFPAQGVRPLFSTISSFFEAALPHFCLEAFRRQSVDFEVRFEDNHLISKFADEEYKLVNEGDLDKIKRKHYNQHGHVKVSAHEAGHAIVYAALFGYAPTQISVNNASNSRKGFIGTHAIMESKDYIIKKIAVGMGGRAAEIISFGEEAVSNGAVGDIGDATFIAANYVRRYGMHETISCIEIPYNGDANPAFYNNDYESSSAVIEDMVQKGLDLAKATIEKHKALFEEVARCLISSMMLDDDEFKEICGKHGVSIEIERADVALTRPYLDDFEKNFGEVGYIATPADAQKVRMQQLEKRLDRGETTSAIDNDPEDAEETPELPPGIAADDAFGP